MKSIFAIILIGFILLESAFGQKDIPSVVTDGLNAYQKTGGKAALAAWLKGSPMENDTTTNISMSGLLGQIETAYGKMVGHDVLQVVTVSPVLQRIYILIRFEKGPVYASFDCYKAPAGWIIPVLNLHTKASEVLPANLLSGAAR
jgi:hypothetical protein